MKTPDQIIQEYLVAAENANGFPFDGKVEYYKGWYTFTTNSGFGNTKCRQSEILASIERLNDRAAKRNQSNG